QELTRFRFGAALLGILRGLFLVRLVAFVNDRLRHRQQLPHKGIELLKLFRRACHFASIVTLLVCVEACLVASLRNEQQQPVDAKSTTEPINRVADAPTIAVKIAKSDDETKQETRDR